MFLNSMSRFRNLFLAMSRVILSADRRMMTDGRIMLSADLFAAPVATDGQFDPLQLEVVTGWPRCDYPALRSISIRDDLLPQIATTGRWLYAHLVMPSANGDCYLYVRQGAPTAPALLGFKRGYIDAIFPKEPPTVLFGSTAIEPACVRPVNKPTSHVPIAFLPEPITSVNPPRESLKMAVARLAAYMTITRACDERYRDWVQASESDIHNYLRELNNARAEDNGHRTAGRG